jgi:hypothetical protein
MQGGFFVELVLNDASPLAYVEDTLKQLGIEHGLHLEVIVRSVWSVENLAFVGAALAPDGGLSAVTEVQALLTSDKQMRRVTVDVLRALTDFLKQRYPDATRATFENLANQLVRTYVEDELRLGGDSYWNPLVSSHRELSDGTLFHLMNDKSESLRRSLDEVATPTKTDAASA